MAKTTGEKEHEACGDVGSNEKRKSATRFGQSDLIFDEKVSEKDTFCVCD